MPGGAATGTLLWEVMTRVPVAVQPRPYEALIEAGLLQRAGDLLRPIFTDRKRCFVVTVHPVRAKWAQKLASSFSASGWDAKFIEMRDGERYKTLATVEELAEKLVKLGADRKAVIVAFGGGVVGDVTGLLASLYMRGVDLVQIPTTSQAQVDAAVGGKTGVNLPAGKNLVGTFHQPRVVLIDPQVLATLPEREFRAGMYEVLKCGVIGNPQLFSRFEHQTKAVSGLDAEELEWRIAESVKLKAKVVSADEREGGLRRVLNFGHTLGHALEAETGYRKFLHGEAIAWGMIAASHISRVMNRCNELTARRITEATLALGRLPKVEVHAREILRAMQGDKKTRSGVAHFVLPREIGKVEIVGDVPEDVVLTALDQIKRFSVNK